MKTRATTRLGSARARHRTLAAGILPILFGTADARWVIRRRARLRASGSRNRVSDAGMRPAHGPEIGAPMWGLRGCAAGWKPALLSAAGWKPALLSVPGWKPALLSVPGWKPALRRARAAPSPRHARLSPPSRTRLGLPVPRRPGCASTRSHDGTAPRHTFSAPSSGERRKSPATIAPAGGSYRGCRGHRFRVAWRLSTSCRPRIRARFFPPAGADQSPVGGGPRGCHRRHVVGSSRHLQPSGFPPCSGCSSSSRSSRPS